MSRTQPPPRALPEGAKMRIGNGNVTDMMFSPDSTRLAVACSYSGVWIYDGHKGEELALLAGHKDLITSFVFSPDGTTIATGGFDKTVKLWDAHTFELRATLTGHAGNTSVLAFSPDSKKIATGASRQVPPERRRGRFSRLPENKTQPETHTDGTVRTWDVLTGKSLKTILTTDIGWIAGLKYAQDNITLASVNTEGIFRTWNTETGQTKGFNLKDVNRNPHFSPDCTRLVIQDGIKTVLYDVTTGKELVTLENDQKGAYATVTYSQNSEMLICRAYNSPEIQIWDAHTGKLNTIINTGNEHLLPMALSPDGRTLTVNEDLNKGHIRFWDTETGESETLFTINVPVYSLLYSPDGRTLAIKSRDISGSVIRLWDIPSASEKAVIAYVDSTGRSQQFSFVASNNDGLLACGIGDTKIWLFDGNTGKFRAALKGHTASVNAVAFSTDGEMLASASNDATVRLWSPRTTQHLGTLEEKKHPEYGVPLVKAVAFSADGLTLASVRGFRGKSAQDIQFWRVDTEKHEGTLQGNPNDVSTIAFSPDRTTIAYCSKGKPTIRLWDIIDRRLKTTYIGHTNSVSTLAYSLDGTLLASGGGYGDGTVKLWNTATGENTASLSEHYPEVTALAFSPDGTLLASAGYGKIEVWDVHFRQHITTLKGHSQRISSLAFTGDGNTLVSASLDQTVVLWNPIPIVDKNIIAKITPSSTVSPVVGKQMTFNIEITGGENVAGYHLTMQFDESSLQYISSTNGDYLPGKPFFMKPNVEKSQVTLASTAITDTGNGDGTLATVTFEVIAVKPTSLNITNLIFSDNEGKRLRATVKSGKVKIK